MISAKDKLKIHMLMPGSKEWFEMWRKVDQGEKQEYGLSIKTKPCPLCVPGIGCYKYVGTFHRSHSQVTAEWRRRTPEAYQFCHAIRHAKHPIAKKTIIRVVPASKNWEPNE